MKFVKGRGMVEKVKHREQRVVSFQGQEDMSGRLPDFRENTLVGGMEDKLLERKSQ